MLLEKSFLSSDSRWRLLKGHFSGQYREYTSLYDDVRQFSAIQAIRPPGTSVPGRAYVLPVMFFFRHAFSEVPRPIALKLCHMVGI